MPMMYTERAKLRSTMAKTLLYTFVGILFIKGAFLLADPQPSYFFGDSIAYLATATAKYIPPDRSFMYGLFIRKTAYAWHSLQAFIWMQVMFSSFAAWLLSFALVKVFSVRGVLAAAAGIFCALEPLQLLAERYIMTECCANFLFAVHIVLILLYVRRGKLWLLLIAQGVGVLLIGFRINFLPWILITSVLPPLVAPVTANTKAKWFGADSGRLLVIAAHIGLSLIVSQSLLTMYKGWYGRLIHREPALFYAQGAFLIADFSPLIEPEDFPDPSRRTAIFSHLEYDRHDLFSRPAQHFREGGLWPNILKQYPDEKQANRLAIETVVHALYHQPMGALGLMVQTLRLYFDTNSIREWLLSDQGVQGSMSSQEKDWLQRIYRVSNPQDYQISIVKRWHLFAVPWYWIILSSLPLWTVLALVQRKSDWPLPATCSLAALMFFAGATLLVDRPTPRFLTSAGWLTLLMLTVTANLLWNRATVKSRR
jgi:hypothetical protein